MLSSRGHQVLHNSVARHVQQFVQFSWTTGEGVKLARSTKTNGSRKRTRSEVDGLRLDE